MIRTALVTVALFIAMTASAQKPVFDVDDFLDPGESGGQAVFISRIVVGAVSDMTADGFRPLGENVGYVHLANSFSWKSMQFDYKRSEMRAEDAEEISREDQEFAEPHFEPKSKDTLQAAWYWPVPTGEGIPVMLRTRVTFTTQEIDTIEPAFQGPGTRTSNRDHTFALDTDTWFRIAGQDVFGSLAISDTKTSGAPINPDEESNPRVRTLTYTNRFPSFSYDRARIVIRPTLTVGGVSNRGGRALNLVNPAIEIFRPFLRSGANLHVIWSPQWNATGDDWKVTHQVAIVVERPLFVKVF